MAKEKGLNTADEQRPLALVKATLSASQPCAYRPIPTLSRCMYVCMYVTKAEGDGVRLMKYK